MKSLMKIIVTIITLLSATFGFSNTDKPTLQIKNESGKIVYLETKDWNATYVEVIIETDNGELLFSEYNIHTETFKRRYNFSELANGTYSLIIKSDLNTQILPVTITKDRLEIDFEHLTIIQ